MRRILLFLFLSVSIQSSFSQNKAITVKIIWTDSLYIKDKLMISLYNKNNSDTILSFFSSNDTFTFDSLVGSRYFMYIKSMLVTQRVKDIDLSTNDTIKLSVDFPPLECPFDKADRLCPYGHRNRTKKIVYGYPDRFLVFKEKLGLISIGGCFVSSCDPNYYCVKHKIEF